MKLLLFSDLHADTFAAQRLLERAANVDVLVGAGDFGNAHHRIRDCIDVLQECGKPTILVAGNNETTEELRNACRNWPTAHVLHGNGVEVEGIPFFGVGGGIPITPFGAWSYDFSEEEAMRLLHSCPENAVLVTHSPPKGIVDRTSSGSSLGSTAIRATIERVHPILVVCGHIHGSGGHSELLGTTPIVNAGPDGIDWELRNMA